MKTVRWIFALAVVALAACGSDSNDSGSPAQEPATPTPPSPVSQPTTIKESIAKLEANGQLPILDRSGNLTGADGNNNGVRDDIDSYVGALTDSQPQKNSLVQLAQAMSATLVVDTTNEAATRDVTDKLNVAVACVWKNYPPEVAGEKVTDIRKVTVNTKTRYDAYKKYGDAVAGAVIKLPKDPNCA